MKKILLLITISILPLTANAQQVKDLFKYEKGENSIGLRLGYGVDVSYQRYFSSKTRLQLDLGTNFSNSFLLSGAYQWVLPITVDNQSGFSWFYGVGATTGVLADYFALGVLGQIGVEYKFNIPLSLSLDWKPTFFALPTWAFGWSSIAFGVRYHF